MNSGSMPLNISFAPRHKITIFGLFSRDQSNLAKPLLEVLPDTLALIIRTVVSSGLNFEAKAEDKFSF